jgi:ubiquinone/menaquinone biosynthesis C-methylase UbiE
MLISPLLRLFFRWLYHPLAFFYDWVAAAVSLGHWNDWGQAAVPFVKGTRVLELGHGPGHLQSPLRSRGFWAVGLDESRQMGISAARRLRRTGYVEVNLVRSLAQSLPFPPESFDTLISTFPSEYFFERNTLMEAYRVLVQGGRLVVLPVAWPANRLLGWLFRITGESPAHTMEFIKERVRKPLAEAGFQAEIETITLQSGVVLIGVAMKGPS